MPYKEKEIEKLYYSISEVAQMYGVNASLIRFWEKQFPQIKPKKNKKGNRLFTKEDIETFDLIYHLVKEKGLTIEGAKKQLKTNPDKVKDNVVIIRKLEEIKNELLSIRKNL
ncbi:MAG: MerR family transcriptional regulator [Marinilabiliales bacterium]